MLDTTGTSVGAISMNPMLSMNPHGGTATALGGVATQSDAARASLYKVIRRNGSVVAFEPSKISVALTKAYLATHGSQNAASARVRELTQALTDRVMAALMRVKPEGGAIHIEEIQDQVELALMRGGEHEVARAYVLYREKRSQERAAQVKGKEADQETVIHVVENGVRTPLDLLRLRELIKESCDGLHGAADADVILKATLKDLYDGVSAKEVRKCTILAARPIHRKRPRVFVRHRTLVARFDPLRNSRGRSDASRDGHQIRRVLPKIH